MEVSCSFCLNPREIKDVECLGFAGLLKKCPVKFSRLVGAG